MFNVRNEELGAFLMGLGEVMNSDDLTTQDVLECTDYKDRIIASMSASGVDEDRSSEIFEECATACRDLTDEFLDYVDDDGSADDDDDVGCDD